MPGRSSRDVVGGPRSGTVGAAMARFADLERLLERVFERSTARLFRTRIQAVQLERRVERAMERERWSEGGRTNVPNRYRVRLQPSDLAEAAGRTAGADALAGRLAESALAFARAHAYHLPGAPVVSLVADPSLSAGHIVVEAITDEPVRNPGDVSVRSPGAAGWVTAEDGDAGISGAGVDDARTTAFRRPAPLAARAVLRTFDPDGGERTIEVDGMPLGIGRAPDNGLVLSDGRASRHHGRLHARHGALVYTDLGSTNGSRVNGVRIDEIALGRGDRLQIGDTMLVVEQVMD